jgi:glycine hydroxymethyltransferase
MRSIADEVGAYAVADVAHIAGLIAGGVLRNPFDDGFDVMLSTTHKTLRGPRGGMILAREPDLGPAIDKSVFPGFQGGPIMQMVAAKAVAFHEALQPEFKVYAQGVVDNAKVLAETLMGRGARLITNGTDNHLMLVDAMTSWGIAGAEAEERLDDVGITLNKNMIADDPRSALDPSGIRLGSPALTTRGMGPKEMAQIGNWIADTLSTTEAQQVERLRQEVRELALKFPVPGIAA